MSEDQSQSDRLDDYVSDDENVAKVSRGAARTFAVTDRRVIDIREGETSEGKPFENVQSTLFTDVAKVDLRIEESITTTDTGQRILAAIIALFGVGALLLTSQLSGSGSTVAAIAGLLGIVAGIYLWVTATESEPGGITIRLRHATPDSNVTDRYVLPEDQQGTAKAVIQQVGRAHQPR